MCFFSTTHTTIDNTGLSSREFKGVCVTLCNRYASIRYIKRFKLNAYELLQILCRLPRRFKEIKTVWTSIQSLTMFKRKEYLIDCEKYRRSPSFLLAISNNHYLLIVYCTFFRYNNNHMQEKPSSCKSNASLAGETLAHFSAHLNSARSYAPRVTAQRQTTVLRCFSIKRKAFNGAHVIHCRRRLAWLVISGKSKAEAKLKPGCLGGKFPRIRKL